MTHRLRLADVLSELDASRRLAIDTSGLLPDNNDQFTRLSRPLGNNATSLADLPAPFRVPLSEPAQFTHSPDYDQPSAGRHVCAVRLERLTPRHCRRDFGDSEWRRGRRRLTDEQLLARVPRAASTRLAAGESTADGLRRLHRLDIGSCRRWPIRLTCAKCSSRDRRRRCHTTRLSAIPTGDRRLG
jgi:hypothetical protein